jgi:hypothetical protein
VFLKKIRAYGDPRLFALNLVSEQMARSQQPLVPERMLMMGGDGGAAPLAGLSLFGKLLSMLLAEKAGLDLADSGLDASNLRELERFVEGFTASGGRSPAAEGIAHPAPDQAAGDSNRSADGSRA